MQHKAATPPVAPAPVVAPPSPPEHHQVWKTSDSEMHDDQGNVLQLDSGWWVVGFFSKATLTSKEGTIYPLNYDTGRQIMQLVSDHATQRQNQGDQKSYYIAPHDLQFYKQQATAEHTIKYTRVISPKVGNKTMGYATDTYTDLADQTVLTIQEYGTMSELLHPNQPQHGQFSATLVTGVPAGDEGHPLDSSISEQLAEDIRKELIAEGKKLGYNPRQETQKGETTERQFVTSQGILQLGRKLARD